jgi:enhancing lycopene biosynthesis protein 2
MPKTIAVILSGCGFYDGAEVHESVLTLLAIDRAGATYECFAPDVSQLNVINHLTGNETNEERNVLVESARIARGKIASVSEYDVSKFDALILPGGFGAAKNLCTFAVQGADCTVHPDVERAVRQTHEAQKPIGALCISPALIARVLGDVEVTIGGDPNTAAAIEKMGARHASTTHEEIVVDLAAKVVTTPCYMLESRISQIANGAANVVRKVLEMTEAG